METLVYLKSVQIKQYRHQNNVGFVLVSLLLPLNGFHNLFYRDLEQVNSSSVALCVQSLDHELAFRENPLINL